MVNKGSAATFYVEDFIKTVGLCINNNKMPSQNYVMNVFFPAVLKRHQDV